MKRSLKKIWAVFLIVCMTTVTVLAEYTPPDGFNPIQTNVPLGNSGLMYTVYQRLQVGTDPENQIHIFRDPAAPEGSDYIIPENASTDNKLLGWIASLVTLVYIDDGVQRIGDSALSGMTLLKTVHIPSSVTRIGADAFRGNSAMRTDSENGILDLSQVTNLGENSFYGCSQITGVTLNSGLTAIPAGVFSGTGLTAVDIPDGVTEIGKSAFSGCQIGNLELPSGLQTIGASAFANNSALQSLVIPEQVVTIGESAFAGNMSLQTVDVRSTVLKKPGANAFGSNQYNAYSRLDSEIVEGETVLVGTMFYTPNEDIENLFESENNCFLGTVSPMRINPDDYQAPTCETSGHQGYIFTWNNIEQEYIQILPPLGHNYEFAGSVPAACETDSYDLWRCTNADLGEGVCEQPEEHRNIGVTEKAKGHHYHVTAIDNYAISDGNSTTVTWQCENENHDGSRPRAFDMTIPGVTLTATTLQTLNEIERLLPDAESDLGSLLWADDVTNRDDPLAYGSRPYHVKFVPTYSTAFDTVDRFDEKDLTIEVNVQKAIPDFSNTTFQNWQRWIGQGTDALNISPLPDGVELEKFQYRESGSQDEDAWSDTPPNEAEGATPGMYEVRAVLTYNPDIYQISTEPDYIPNDTESVLSTGPEGTCYITHRYTVAMMSMDAASYTVKTPLTYTGSQQNTLTMTGVPAGAKLEFTYTKDGGVQQTYTLESAPAGGNFDTLPLAAAGTYTVDVHITHPDYNSKDFEDIVVTIEKRPVEVPRVNNTDPSYPFIYTPGVEHTGVLDPASEAAYTLDGNKATNAGNYTAVAKLKDPANYRWDSEEFKDSETANIPWTVLRRGLVSPSLRTAAYTYDGQSKRPVSDPSSGDYEISYSDGTMIVGFRGEENVFTVTNAEKTNAGEYPSVAEISADKRGNYYWQDYDSQETASWRQDLGTWRISKVQIRLGRPGVTSPEYTGQPFDESNINSTNVIPEEYRNILRISGYEYYTSSSGGSPIPRPVDVGSYYFTPVYEFLGGELADNYQLLGDGTGRIAFSITKKTVQLPATQAQVTYDGTAKYITDPTPADMISPDDAYSLVYKSYTYAPPGGEAGDVQIPNDTSQSPPFTEAGTYQVTVGLDSTNYTAADAVCTLTIDKATNQGIDFKSEDDAWNDGTNTITKTYGDPEFIVTGEGTLDSSADITYSITTEYQAYATVDSGNGTVAIHGATSEQGIPVTATAAETANAAAASGSYTLIINKAGTTTALEQKSVPFDGQAVTDIDYANATVTQSQGTEPPNTETVTYKFYDTQEEAGAGAGEGIDAPTNVGIYWLRADYPGSNNYNGSYAVAQFEITAADLVVAKQDTVTREYDGTEYALASAIDSVTNAEGAPVAYSITFIKAQAGEDNPSAVDSGRWNDAVAGAKNVSDSGAYFYKIEAENYAPAYGSVQVTINPRPIELTANVTAEKTYDGNQTAVVANPAVSGEVTGEITSVTAAALYDTKESGTGKTITTTYTLTFAENAVPGNYSYGGTPLTGNTVEVSQFDGVISPIELTVTIPRQTKVYDGTGDFPLTGDVSIDNPPQIAQDEGVTASLAAGASASTESNVDANEGGDPYPFETIGTGTVLLSDTQNYRVTAVNCPDGAVITKRPVTLGFAENIDKNYDEQPYNMTADRLTGGGELVAPDTLQSLLESNAITFGYKAQGAPDEPYGDAPTAIGSYTVRMTLNHTNYSAAEVTKEFAILPAALQISDVTAYTEEYDGAGHPAANMTVNDFQGTPLNGNPDLRIVYLKKGAADEPAPSAGDSRWQNPVTEVKNVADTGDYWYRVSYPNHADAVGEQAVTVQITPKAITIDRALTETKVYDNTLNAAVTLNSTNAGDTAGGETITVSAPAASYDSENVGTGKTITVTYTLETTADLANYSFNGSRVSGTAAQTATVTEQVQTGEITQRPVHVTGVTAENRTYNGSNLVNLTGTPLGTAQSPDDGLIDGDDIGLILAGSAGEMLDANAGSGKTVNIGADDVTLTGASAGNYSIADVAHTTVDIAQATPTLTFENGANLTHGFNNQPVSEDVYRATAAGVAGGVTPTGTITYVFYTNPERTEPYINPETNNIPINVGTYYLTATLAADTNYLTVSADATLQIQTAGEGRLEVTPAPHTAVYDGASHPAAQFTVTGDGVPLTEGAANGYTIAFSETEGGPYTIDQMPSVKHVSDSKTWYYQVTTTNYGTRTGSFTVAITPKDLKVSHDAIAKTYNGTTEAVVNGPSFDTGGGAEFNETVTAAVEAAVYNSPDVTAPDAQNNVTVTYTLTAGENTVLADYTFGGQTVNEYNQITLTETGSITPAAVHAELIPQSAVYDGTSKTAGSAKDVNWSTLDQIYAQNGTPDDLGVILSIPENSVNAGSYPITGSATNPNYTVTFSNGAGLYTVTHRPITVQIGSGGGVYGDEPVLSGITLTDATNTPGDPNDGLVSGEDIANFGIALATDGTAGQPITDADSSYRIYAVNGGAEVTAPTGYGNYNVTFINGGYTITPRPITITVNDHGSAYLAPIDGGIANPALGTDYTAVYTNEGGKPALYGGDSLAVTLATTANSTAGDPNSNAGRYPITAQAVITRTDSAEDMMANYAVTYTGQTAFGNQTDKGTYTIRKARLDIAFQNSDQADSGLSIAMTDSYTNPLVLTNLDANSPVEVAGDIAAIKDAITYTSNNQDVVNDTGITKLEDASAQLAISGTGSARIDASVPATANYEAAATWFILNVGEGGAISIQFETLNLQYTGQPQDLVKVASITPSDAKVEYRLGTDGAWSETIPQQTNAGTYTVYYRATKAGYAAAEGDRTVIISKAENPARFTADQKAIAYAPALVFNGDDPANGNPLTGIPADYTKTADIEYTSANPAVAWAQDRTHTLDITGTGDAVITAVLPEDDNYLRKEVSYTLRVGTSATGISYTAEGYTGVYDREEHSITVTVTSPAEYQILYSTDGTQFSEEKPQFTDAGTYTVFFQITADGFEPVEGKSETVTIDKKPITADMFRDSVSTRYTYIGSPIEPPVTVIHNGWTLTEGAEYEVLYGSNTDTAEGSRDGSVTVKAVEGDGKNYTGEATVYFDIEPIDANYMTAALDRYYGTYDDPNTNHATVSVMFGQEKLVNGTDYDLSCKEAGLPGHENCWIAGDTVTFGSVGTHTIVVTGKGNYTDSQTELSFYLMPKAEDGGLSLIADEAAAAKIYTYGDAMDGTVQVKKPGGADGEYLTEGTDYTLSYQYYDNLGNVSDPAAYTAEALEQGAGMYVVTAQAQGSYEGTGSFVFLIQKRDLAGAVVNVETGTGLIYNGTAQEPLVAADFTEYPGLLTETDYDTVYRNNSNAGEAQVILTAKADSNNFTGSVSAVFTIAPKDISSGFTVDEIPDQIYTGSAVTPAVTVKDENGTPLNDTDYTVSYQNNTAIGTATASVAGRGNYTGTIADIPFSIVAVSNTFALAVGKTEWVYDGKANAGSITVTYDGNPLTIVRDYTLTVAKDGGEPVVYQTAEEAVQAMIEPGTYTVAAAGANNYAGVAPDTVTVTVEKIQPVITITATPKTLSGRGTITLTVTAQNLPEGTVLTELTVTRDGETQEPLELTAAEDGYTAEFEAPNENAVYTFSIATAENEHYLAASAEAEATVVRKTAGGGGSWGGGGGSGSSGGESWGGGGGPAEEEEEHVILTHNAYLIGYADGTFQPEGNITRAEAATIFARLLADGGEIPQASGSVFEDVLPGDWFYDSVNYLQEYGIILGRDDTHFDPNENITRAEFVTICTRFDAYNAVETINSFTDVEASHWAYAYINYAVHEHWINGYEDGSFRPDAFITRAEAVNVVNNVLERSADTAFVEAHSDYANRFTDLSAGHWAYYEIMEAAIQHSCYLDEEGEHWQEDESVPEEDGQLESDDSV